MMKLLPRVIWLSCLLLLLGMSAATAQSGSQAKSSPQKAKTATTQKKTSSKAAAPKPSSQAASKRASKAASAKKRASARKAPARKRVVRSSRWKEPTYADSTAGDQIDGEDLVVRRAAVEALGPYNGSVVVLDADTGRLLTIVNQKLAFKSGFQPCSTIKVAVGMAGLMEGLIDSGTKLQLSRRVRMDLTEAMARSNNPYFAILGKQLGFERVRHYARMFGMGERAGLDIDEEQPGRLPEEPPKNGGVGMMSSFGEGITLTPLQLAGFLGAIANGGTLHYLQYPRTQEEAENLVPRVKRHLEFGPWLPEIAPGLHGTVDFGTGRRAALAFNEPLLGKTGTCTDRLTPTHLGWFGAFNRVGNSRLVVVVLLTGGKPVNGPVAAGIAGNVFRHLSVQQFFAQSRGISPAAIVSGLTCCLQ